MDIYHKPIGKPEVMLASNLADITIRFDDDKKIIVRHLHGFGLTVITPKSRILDSDTPIRRTMLEPIGNGSFNIYQWLPELDKEEE